jgi:PAS domain S-box-containing protein
MLSSPIQVLVVDDEPDLCSLSKEFLDIPGEIDVDVACSVNEARKALGGRSYHVIVSDYQMAGEDGIQFLKSLRSVGNTTPFILFTGKGREEVAIEALNNGAEGYLQKGGLPRPMYTELEHRIRAAASKRRGEEEIARALSILESTMESTADGILVVDGKGKIVLFNNIFRKMWGIPEEIIESKDDLAAINSVLDQLKEPDHFISSVKELYSDPERVSFDVIELRDGRVFERYSQPQWIGDSVSGRVWSFRDVTAQKKMEETLRKSETLHRSILNASPDAIIITDPEGMIKMVSPAGLKMFGHCEGEDIQGRSIMNYLASEERERALGNIRSMFRGVFMGPDTYRATKVDGSTLDIEVNADLVQGTDGLPSGIIIVVRDITERRRMELELKESEEFHRQLTSNLSMGVVIIDPLTRTIEKVNEAAALMFGAAQERIEGKICHSFLCPALVGACPVCDLGKEVDNSEKVLVCADGSRLPIIKSVKKITVRGKEKLLESFIDISERKNAEDTLKASEARFRALFDALVDTMWVIDQEAGRFVDVNPAASRMYGFTREEFLAMDVGSISAEPEDTWRSIHENGQVFVPLRYHRRKDGNTFPVEITSNTFVVAGRTTVICSVRDITKQKNAEKELQESEAKYRGLFDHLQDMVSLLRLEFGETGEVIDQIMIDANAATLRTLNKGSMNDVRGKRTAELVSPQATKDIQRNIREMKRTGEPVTEVVRSSVGDREFLTTFVPLGADNVIMTSTDISDHIAAKKDRLKSIQRYDGLASRINGGIYLLHSRPDGTFWFDYLSPKMAEIFDLGQESVLTDGQVIAKSIHPDDLGALQELNRERIRLVQKFEWEGRLLIRGTVRWLKMESSPEPLENGDTLWHGIAIDITERKQMEQALRDSEEKFRQIFDHANDAIRVHGLDENGFPGRFVYANVVACGMLGYSLDEMLQMRPSDISTGNYDPAFPNVIETLRTVGSAKFETEHMHKNGSIIPVEINAHIVEMQGKKTTIAVVRDISENKRCLNAIRCANEKLNLLSSITRHDIRNQLMAMSGYLALIKDKQVDPVCEQHLRKAEAAAEKISAMIQFTKNYEDIGVNAPTWQNVHDLVESCSKEVHVGLVKIFNDVPTGIEVFADPLIVKVFNNLMDNAVRHGQNARTIRFRVEDRNGVRAIVCEDDGRGIPEDKRSRLFNKEFGRDHGLGLFLTREILAITGISISEVGCPGQGARFVMLIPSDGVRGALPAAAGEALA